MLMVFRPASCPGVLTRFYLYTILPSWAAAKLVITCPHVPRTLWPCPNPRHPHATYPRLALLSVGHPSASPGLSSPAAGWGHACTHPGEEGTCLTLSAGPVCPPGQGSHDVCLTQVILQ